jgi:hypothetical protein
MAKSLFRGQAIQLLAAAARTTSSNSGNLRDTVGNIPASEAIAFLINVTTLTIAGPSPAAALDVWIDTSPDGGTTWFLAYKFAQITSSTAARRLNVRTTGIGIAEAGTEASVATSVTAATSNNTVLSPDIRVRWEITGGTNSASSNFGVWAIAMPPGTK